MNTQQLLEDVVADQIKAPGTPGAVPELRIGDTLNVHVRIIEGDKERIQVYQGVLIARKGRGVNRTITVRRIVANEGVERIFPLYSPRIAQIDVVRRADAHRAKLYYLRERVGKSRRLRDQRRGLQRMETVSESAAAAESASASPGGVPAASASE
jgi:large subunit ribosomal protein L19